METRIARFLMRSIACLSVVLASACLRAPVPPPPAGVPCPIVFATESQQVIVEGKADDAEDTLGGNPLAGNPAGGGFYGPVPGLTGGVRDGAAIVGSTAGAFNALRAKVSAWKRATAGPRRAKSFGRVTGTSVFGVPGPAPVHCQFEIDSGAEVGVKGGITRYRARAEIFDATDAPIRGASFLVEYEFQETLAGAVDYYESRWPGQVPLRRVATLPVHPITGTLNPTRFSFARITTDLGPPGGFILAPGSYVVRYTLTAEGDASRQTAPNSGCVSPVVSKNDAAHLPADRTETEIMNYRRGRGMSIRARGSLTSETAKIGYIPAKDALTVKEFYKYELQSEDKLKKIRRPARKVAKKMVK